MGFGVWGLGFGVSGLIPRDYESGAELHGSGFKVQDLRFKVWGLRFKQGLRFEV